MWRTLTANFSSVSFFRPSSFTKNLSPIAVLLLSLLLVPCDSQGNEQSKSFVANLRCYWERIFVSDVSQRSQRYTIGGITFGKYFKLYQQKNDPRDFVLASWGGFSADFRMLDAENQLVAILPWDVLGEPAWKAVTTPIFGELRMYCPLILAFRVLIKAFSGKRYSESLVTGCCIASRRINLLMKIRDFHVIKTSRLYAIPRRCGWRRWANRGQYTTQPIVEAVMVNKWT